MIGNGSIPLRLNKHMEAKDFRSCREEDYVLSLLD